jgi:hypothetical protein
MGFFITRLFFIASTVPFVEIVKKNKSSRIWIISVSMISVAEIS